VVDATNVRPESRKPLVELAREHYVQPVAIVFDLPMQILDERSKARTDRILGAHVLRNQRGHLRRSLRDLQREGFRHVWIFRSPEEIETVELERRPLWPDRRSERGPFDLIGDVHGCGDELEELLTRLGYGADEAGVWRHPQGRKAVFLGDIVDRGPRVTDVLRIVMRMVTAGSALCVPGNHDEKLLRWLRGKKVRIAHGLEQSVEQLEDETPSFRADVAAFLDGLISHYVLDGGKLVVAHAGMKQEMIGRASSRVRAFALYGETTGEMDELGLPVRLDWAADYRGPAMVVYGHTPVAEPRWLNRTINVDTGCVFGGALTALRYPEMDLVSVPAHAVYAGTSRPFLPEESALTPQQAHDDVLDLEDVLGKRIIHTRLRNDVTIREENAAAALEAMSRFAVDPKWLIYLPPTMSPSETSSREDLLEHPAEAFAYFRSEQVERVVCEEKHMGSRAVVIVCRDGDEARRRFGVVVGGDDGSERGEVIGTCFTRTGRRFFDDSVLERALLLRLREAIESAGLWERLGTGWVCLDAELMPWSVKAQELIREQYAAVGAAARIALPKAVARLAETGARGLDTAALLARYRQRFDLASRFTEAYRRYCWPVASVADLRLAPFHLLASEGAVHIDKDNVWHMETLADVCREDPKLFVATPYKVVDLSDPASETAATEWWEELTGKGGEGMVVKPFDFVARGRRGIAQPALKCRGREYLRIIYGPEYTMPENLERLRRRGLAAKRALALREFALGVEGLERFVGGEPLRRVHECAFGVLALESEPVDPRL
jgi:protein phosphatase